MCHLKPRARGDYIRGCTIEYCVRTHWDNVCHLKPRVREMEYVGAQSDIVSEHVGITCVS